jgi:hypothetical protein
MAPKRHPELKKLTVLYGFNAKSKAQFFNPTDKKGTP